MGIKIKTSKKFSGGLTLEEYKESLKLLEEWNYEYYINDNSPVSDAQYDSVMFRVLEFEKNNPDKKDKFSVTSKIGCSVALSKLTKVTRARKMFSLANAFTKNDIQKYLKDTKNASEYIMEWKYDGLGIELTYRRGELVLATTRGDGFTGEDVTHNVRLIRNLPLKLNKSVNCTVRGEVVISRKVFQKSLSDNTGYSNPRNMAAGIVRSKDTLRMQKYPMSFMAYNLFMDDGSIFLTHEDSLLYGRELGFRPIIFKKVSGNLDNLERTYKIWLDERELFEFDVDGIVLKLNNLELSEELGTTFKYPKADIAWKFPTIAVPTTIKRIEDTLGRTGVITPVMIFQPPVVIDGVTVSQATGHNYADMHLKGLGVGAQVKVTRNGGVVPGVSEVLVPAKKPHTAPRFCPVCKSLTRQLQAEVTCTNPNCPEVLAASMLYFASKTGMDIDGIGKESSRKLIEIGVKTPLDLCNPKTWQEPMLSQILKVLGAGRTNQILSALKERWESGRPYPKYLKSLGLPEIGEQKCLPLAENFPPERLLKAKSSDFREVHSLGTAIGERLEAYVKDNHDMLVELFGYIHPVILPPKVSGKLSGQHFCITGTLEAPRREVEDRIVAQGGTVQKSVTRKTDFLIVGENPGRDKLLGADRYSAHKISEKDFLSGILGEKA